MPTPRTSGQVETEVPVWPREGRAPNLLGPRGFVDGEVYTHASLVLMCVAKNKGHVPTPVPPSVQSVAPEVPAHHQHSLIQVFIERGRSLSMSHETNTLTSEDTGKQSSVFLKYKKSRLTRALT